MKIVSRPIRTIAVFESDGKPPRPYRFKWVKDDGEEIVIKVDDILDVSKQKKAGIESLVYRCQSSIGDTEKVYELKYDLAKCRWQLYKM